ncbi:hypothetical protein ACIBH1_41015 [Nonomuraea sp. NPDC050663]|uniref:hypothetical protein n=1 Tax=Nonomuraea sp. NPDC050663 TaxID=3364370 RepID=UPI0037B3402A
MRSFLALAVLVLLAGCQSEPPPKYSSNNNTDSPCARVVSAIGYAELMLEPKGREESQNFEAAVLGRIAETRGINAEFGGRLPAGAQAAAGEVERTAAGLATADIPRDRQVELLKRYRAATDEIRKHCAGT